MGGAGWRNDSRECALTLKRRCQMKHLLLTTIAAVVLVGCGPSEPPDISIHRAAREGNIEAVKQHLEAGMDVDVEVNNRFGGTPLYFAASGGHREVVELFITEGANVNAKDWMGRTPLNDAAGRGYKEIVEILLANGADVNAKDNDGDTPLDWAIYYKEPDKEPETADLLRKHGGKMGEELKAEGK